MLERRIAIVLGRTTRAAAAVLAIMLLAAASACGGDRAGAAAGVEHVPEGVPRGGELTAAIRDDPPTFNPYVGRNTNVLEVITRLLHAPLVRIDRITGEVEPWLAERWAQSDDGLTWTLMLRKGVCFSDGSPFTSADVIFALSAVYDARSVSAIGDSLLVNGQPITAEAPDGSTVILRFPTRPGAGLQILDNLPILPRHKLEAAQRDGRLKEQWTLATAPSEVVGLGPFRLAAYQSSERIVLERNPFYWRRDARGATLPHLDRVTLAVVRDQNTEVLRMQNGQIDISAREIRPEDYVALRRDEARGRVQLADAGVGLDPNMLWFNLSPAAYAGDSRKPWLQSEDFRKAISHAVDRKTLVDQVFLGAAVPVFGPVTPGNRSWYAAGAPEYPYDPARASALLAGLGLTDRNGDRMLEDRGGRPVRFSILSQQQDTIRMRTLSVVQEQLRRIGVVVDIAGVDGGTIVQRWARGQYDAIYFGVEATSYDPANNLDFWLSSGSFHLWNAEQKTPATEWERRIDALMQRQVLAADQAERRRLFEEAQRILGEHLPVICFAAPRVIMAMTPRVVNATPVPLKPPVLWNADTLAVSR